MNYKRNVNCETIESYVDADWAGDNVDRKSTSGYVIKVFGNVIAKTKNGNKGFNLCRICSLI